MVHSTVCARGVTDSLRIPERQLSKAITDTPDWPFLFVDAWKIELRYGTAGLNLPIGSYHANYSNSSGVTKKSF